MEAPIVAMIATTNSVQSNIVILVLLKLSLQPISPEKQSNCPCNSQYYCDPRPLSRYPRTDHSQQRDPLCDVIQEFGCTFPLFLRHAKLGYNMDVPDQLPLKVKSQGS